MNASRCNWQCSRKTRTNKQHDQYYTADLELPLLYENQVSLKSHRSPNLDHTVPREAGCFWLFHISAIEHAQHPSQSASGWCIFCSCLFHGLPLQLAWCSITGYKYALMHRRTFSHPSPSCTELLGSSSPPPNTAKCRCVPRFLLSAHH